MPKSSDVGASGPRLIPPELIVLRTLRDFALLIRLPNSFTVLSNVLAAYTVAVAGAWRPLELAALCVVSLCFYHGGMVLNDCLDVEEDRRDQPHRPLARGAISLGFAWGFTILALGLGLLLLIPYGNGALAMGGVLVLAILGYNFSSREGLLGCLLMGLCRGLNWALVLTALGALGDYGHYALVVAVYVTALTCISRDEASASRPWLLWLSMLGMAVAALIFLILFDWSASWVLVQLAVFLLGVLVVVLKLFSVLNDYRPETLRAAVMFFVIGLIPLDACLVFVTGYPVAALAILALLLPGKMLARRLYVS